MSWRQRHVVITGLMGSGKTVVGREVARALGTRLDDSDVTITAGTGMTGKQIAESDGVGRLHDLEAGHVIDALGGEPCVVAAAASVLDDRVCLQALTEAWVVFLDVAPERLAARLEALSHRRRLDDPIGDLTEMRARRLAAARSIGAVIVEPGERSPHAIAQEIVSLVR